MVEAVAARGLRDDGVVEASACDGPCEVQGGGHYRLIFYKKQIVAGRGKILIFSLVPMHGFVFKQGVAVARCSYAGRVRRAYPTGFSRLE